MTLAHAFADVIDKSPDRPLWIFRNGQDVRVLTREQVGRMACAQAQRLRYEGIGRDGRVVIAHPTSPEFVVNFCAVQLIGATAIPAPVPLPGRRFESELRRLRLIIDHGEASHIACPEAVADMLEGEHGRGARFVATPLDEVEFTDSVVGPAATDSIAVIQFTSGSTAQPRGAMLSHTAILRNARACAERLEIRAPQCGVNWCPLFHDMALVGSVILPMVSTHVSVIQTPPDAFLRNPLCWVRLIDEYRAELSAAPSSSFGLVARRLAHVKEDDAFDLSCMRHVFCGAEPINPATIRGFLREAVRFGFPESAFHAAYGLAEHVVLTTSKPGGLSTQHVDRDALERETSARPGVPGAPSVETVNLGQPVDGCELRISSPDTGEPLEERAVGRVELRSPSLMTRYTTHAAVGEWFQSGDLGYIADGDLFLLGRSTDVVFIGGRNIYCYDIERAASAIPGTHESRIAAFHWAAATGDRELVGIAVETRLEDTASLEQDIRAAVVNDLGVELAKVWFVKPGTIPKTSSGKAQRSLLAEMFCAERERQRQLTREEAGGDASARLVTPKVAEHYDVPVDFYRLWLDSSLTYSGAMWRAATDLDTAQRDKLDFFIDNTLAVDKRVLDVGCGWGSLLERAVQRGVREAVGLTLSAGQAEHCEQRLQTAATVNQCDWRDYTGGPFDAIISIGAFEHFSRAGVGREARLATYREFFATCYRLLERGGRLGLQSIAYDDAPDRVDTSIAQFVYTEIFPDSTVPRATEILSAADAYFRVVEMHTASDDYARTCDAWRRKLRDHRVRAAELVGEETVARYLKYLGVSRFGFRTKQWTLTRWLFERRAAAIEC